MDRGVEHRIVGVERDTLRVGKWRSGGKRCGKRTLSGFPGGLTLFQRTRNPSLSFSRHQFSIPQAGCVVYGLTRNTWMGCGGYYSQESFPNDWNSLGVLQNILDCVQELSGAGLVDEHLRRVAKHYSPKLSCECPSQIEQIRRMVGNNLHERQTVGPGALRICE